MADRRWALLGLEPMSQRVRKHPPTFLGSADGSGPSALSACGVRILDVHKYDCGAAALSFARLAHSRRDAASDASIESHRQRSSEQKSKKGRGQRKGVRRYAPAGAERVFLPQSYRFRPARHPSSESSFQGVGLGATVGRQGHNFPTAFFCDLRASAVYLSDRVIAHTAR
jgi:hypothetical protein